MKRSLTRIRLTQLHRDASRKGLRSLVSQTTQQLLAEVKMPARKRQKLSTRLGIAGGRG
jgi:hypothetical protein